jgi:hypothetical protein
VINTGRRVEVIHVGCKGSPVIIIDGFSPDPQALVTRAANADFIDAGSTYPGVRAPAPQSYVDSMLSATSGLIAQHFGAQPTQLRAIQRIPHFDGPEEDRIAFLHYLCGPHQGGTSFFRHLATDLERVTRERAEEYRQAVIAEMRAEPPVRTYFVDDARRFERLARIDARFNRLIIYRGNALHSGDILDSTVLSEDPCQGRLTINGFGRLQSRC